MVSAIFSVSQAWIQLYMYEESSGMQKTFACAGGLVRTRASEQVARAVCVCMCVCVCVCSEDMNHDYKHRREKNGV